MLGLGHEGVHPVCDESDLVAVLLETATTRMEVTSVRLRPQYPVASRSRTSPLARSRRRRQLSPSSAPMGSFASSASSSSGIAASSCRSFSINERWLSRWLLTDTYSPRAIEMAPPMRPAAPAAKIGAVAGVAPATPTTIAATETMPSLAPSTPARNQFSRPVMPAPCGSPEWAATGVDMLESKHCGGASTTKVRLDRLLPGARYRANFEEQIRRHSACAVTHMGSGIR